MNVAFCIKCSSSVYMIYVKIENTCNDVKLADQL